MTKDERARVVWLEKSGIRKRLKLCGVQRYQRLEERLIELRALIRKADGKSEKPVTR